MARGQGASPVAPALLEYVDDYIAETSINDAVQERDLDAESNLVVFYRELFAQLFANVIGERITSIGPTSARRARAIYRTRGSTWSPALKALVRSFQHFCKVYPDLLGEQYGEGSDAVMALHMDLLPKLLVDIRDWAREEGLDELEAGAAASAEKYNAYVADFDMGTP